MKRKLRELLPLLLGVFTLLAARSSLADHYVVPTGSMEHTLVPGDRVLVDKTAYGLRLPFLGTPLMRGAMPSRGEVVIFDSPRDGTRLIKRVVAVAGDRVALRDGHLVVNGAPVGQAAGEAEQIGAGAEQIGGKTARLNLAYGGGPDVPETVVPAGQLFVLGDARGNSADSRAFGFVAASEIYARAERVYHRAGSGFVWLPL